MTNAPALSVSKIRARFYVVAGESKLSKGFKTEASAIADLEQNADFYSYWAGSASVSIENSEKVIINAG